MAFATVPMDFSHQSMVQQENYPPSVQPQVYTDYTGPFYHHPEMPVYTDYTELYQQQQHNLQNIQPEASFWHLQVPHTTKDSRQMGANGKPKRRRTATQAQRRAANVRERRRMFNLNESFDQLRTRVPTFAYEKRLSRIETLRLAITYISFLNQLIEGVQPDEVKLIAMPKSSEVSRVKRAIEKDQNDEDYFDGVSDTSSDV